MGSNRAEQDVSRSADTGLLQRRLVRLSSGHPSHVDQDRPGQSAGPAQLAPRQEARARLKAGGHNNLRQAMKPGDNEAKSRASKTWHLWAVFDLLLLLLIVPLVIAVPVVLDCRQKWDNAGFFAGQTFERCINVGIAGRWNALDSRLKMIMHGSGQ